MRPEAQVPLGESRSDNRPGLALRGMGCSSQLLLTKPTFGRMRGTSKLEKALALNRQPLQLHPSILGGLPSEGLRPPKPPSLSPHATPSNSLPHLKVWVVRGQGQEPSPCPLSFSRTALCPHKKGQRGPQRAQAACCFFILRRGTLKGGTAGAWVALNAV